MRISVTVNGRRPTEALSIVRALEARMGQTIAKKKTESAQQTLAKAMGVFNRAVAYCPEDTGNLKASAYIVWTQGVKGLGLPIRAIPHFAPQNSGKWKFPVIPGYTQIMKANHRRAVADAYDAVNRTRTAKFRFRVAVGFSAYYAMWVHEGHAGMVSAPATKFLERAVEESHADGDIGKPVYHGEIVPGEGED